MSRSRSLFVSVALLGCLLQSGCKGGAFEDGRTATVTGKYVVDWLVVEPAPVDLGVAFLGCASRTQEVRISYPGLFPVKLQKVWLEGCGNEFKLLDPPSLPALVPPYEALVLSVYYQPADLGADSCKLVVEDQRLSVTLKGIGAQKLDTQVDEFISAGGHKVDILFVVDNSGSMKNEQENLAQNFSALLNEAKRWNNDVHVGVITTDSGQLRAATGKPSVLRLTYTKGGEFDFASLQADFLENVAVGVNGSAQEKGLEAARLALSPPLSTTTTVPCTSDSDCVAQGLVCVETFPDTAEVWPHKVCGGRNAGLRRPNARLEIVFVSDEEDHSPLADGEYKAFFSALVAEPSMVHAHAIVGPEGGCKSAQGSAQSGKRYRDLATALGGKIGSICELNFAEILKDIGERAFAVDSGFVLSQTPVESSIVVAVNGTAVSSGWEYLDTTNSIRFDGQSTPPDKALVRVTYTPRCLAH